MAITYNWNIDHMEAHKELDGKENVIFSVSWRIVAEDGEMADSYGTTTLKYDENSYFIPYSEMTKDVVISWVKDVLGEDRIASIENSLEKDIEEKKNQTTTVLVPNWQ